MGAVVSTIVAVVTAILPFFQKSPSNPPKQIDQPTQGATKTKEQMIQEARNRLGIDVVNNFNYGICGKSGSGKSSTVNAWRGKRDSDSGAAPVGETETTSTTTPYPHPNYPHIVFWDLPGAGTNNHSANDYFEQKCLYAFDCLIVVCSDRFMEIDLDIAYQAVQWGVPVFFVRNMFDKSLESRKRRTGESTEVAFANLQTEILDNIRAQLQTRQIADHSVYLISAWKYLDNSIVGADEGKLIKDVLTISRSRRI
eukprot:gene4095-4775_t